MILINKGTEPDALIKERCDPEVKEYGDLSGDATSAIRNNLLKEQGYICAYCMKRLQDSSQTKIEHYIARNLGDENTGHNLELDYKNMLGVCYGNAMEPGTPEEGRTCDAHKGNASLTVNPLDELTIKQIKYTENGKIYSNNTNINEDLNKKLNLNSERASLKYNRKSALDALKKEVYKKVAKDKSHEQYINYLKKCYNHYSYSSYTKKQPYVGIILWYLKLKIGTP